MKELEAMDNATSVPVDLTTAISVDVVLVYPTTVC